MNIRRWELSGVFYALQLRRQKIPGAANIYIRGHIIPLAQVNRQLRCSLINDNGYWVFLLQTRLNVKLTGKR